jgi:methionyl-tRNA formyltransferase
MLVATQPVGAAVGLSVHYPRVLGDHELQGYGSIYNLHPGYLPWGRGHFPLVWAIWLGEPAGATLHRLVRRLDGGPLVDQRRVEVQPTETAYELYQRLCAIERSIFDDWWPRIASGRVLPARPQPGGGSYHDKAEFQALLGTDIRAMSPGDVDRLRRALSFPGRPGLQADATDARP